MRSPLSDIGNQTFDVVVIGGGINGASVARHLAEAGHRVLLAEKSDFGAGASGRSTRLIHNGIWYLAAEGSDFWDMLRRPRLLAHNLRMARQLLANQTEAWRSHGRWMHRLTFLLPQGGGNPYKLWQMELGLWALNLAALSKGSLPFWRVDDPRRYLLLRYHRPDGSFEGALAFDDLMADAPERLCVDLALETEAAGGTVANYARVAQLRRAGSGWSVGIEDALYEDTVEVNARVVVNAAGTWCDQIDRMVSRTPPKRMEAVKGNHILVKTPEHQPGVALLTFNSDGSDKFFAVPFRGMYMMGNTHTVYHDDPDHVFVRDEEVEYLLREANIAFPGARVTEESIVYTYGGVRPMSFFGGSWALEPMIHDLEAQEGIPNAITLTGGPVTTYPGIGRQVAQLARRKLAAAGHPVGAGPGPSLRTEADTSAARGVAAELICEHGPATLRDAAIGLVREHAASLSDVLCRRTVHVWNECMGLHCARRVAETLAPLAGWDAPRVDREVADYTDEVMTTFRPRGAAAL